MLILEGGEVCPYADECPNNTIHEESACCGARSDRDWKFTCELVENGKIKEMKRKNKNERKN